MQDKIPTTLTLTVAEIKAYIKLEDNIETRVKKAMKHASTSWCTTNDEHRFIAAVAAVMCSYEDGSEEKEMLENEMKAIRQLNAMLVAAQAGLSVNVPDMRDEEKRTKFGLMNVWRETIKERDNARK